MSFSIGDKRSVEEIFEEKLELSEEHLHSDTEPEPLPVDPVPFDFAKHGARYRRQSVHCGPNDTRHVLFMLDTSSTVREPNFVEVTETLGKLVRYFCAPIKVAVMTFSHEKQIEFCFDCFNNSCAGREEAKNAIQRIEYRGGGTFTGEATDCACRRMLTSQCGFSEFDLDSTRCLDVIYVTDGRSNGARDVCNDEVMNCVYDLNNTDVNVFAFGVGDFKKFPARLEELNCITRDNETHVGLSTKIYTLQNFKRFSMAVDDLAIAFETHGVHCFADSRDFDEIGDDAGDEVCEF